MILHKHTVLIVSQSMELSDSIDFFGYKQNKYLSCISVLCKNLYNIESHTMLDEK